MSKSMTAEQIAVLDKYHSRLKEGEELFYSPPGWQIIGNAFFKECMTKASIYVVVVSGDVIAVEGIISDAGSEHFCHWPQQAYLDSIRLGCDVYRPSRDDEPVSENKMFYSKITSFTPAPEDFDTDALMDKVRQAVEATSGPFRVCIFEDTGADQPGTTGEDEVLGVNLNGTPESNELRDELLRREKRRAPEEIAEKESFSELLDTVVPDPVLIVTEAEEPKITRQPAKPKSSPVATAVVKQGIEYRKEAKAETLKKREADKDAARSRMVRDAL